MHVFFAFTLICTAIFIFYLLSLKKINQTRQSRFSFLTSHSKTAKIAAYVSLLMSLFLLAQQMGNSIGLVALCIFAAPLLFIFILKVNNLKPKTKL